MLLTTVNLMNILAFAASSSSTSINKMLVSYAARIAREQHQAHISILDINHYELPLFSIDREQELGQPKLAQDFLKKIALHDMIFISFAEHNGTYTAAYKNLFDWCSRINPKVFQNKPMLMLSTSPGARGGASVLQQAVNSAPFFDGEVKAHLSVPSFGDNFDVEHQKLTNASLDQRLHEIIAELLAE